MFAFKVIGFFGLIGCTLAADCISGMGNRCLPKSEAGGYSVFMNGGDPCFVYNNDRWCFVTPGSGSMEPCSCTAQCGCTDVPVVPSAPKCDNSAVPSNPECSADKTTYCASNMEETTAGVTYKNTMCLYCGVDTKACNKLCTRGLTADEQKVILDKHNALRRQVAKGLETIGVNGPQPSAADMFELVWDPVLAASAQRWADQCPNGHDKNRLVPGYPYVGQNMADSWNSANSAEKALETKVQAWYNEVKDWPAANVGSFSSNGATGVVGHYTQLIWGSTKKVGCGFVQYMDPAKPTIPYRQTLFCNYGKGGNMSGDKVYTTGAPGSKCPNGVNDGLCKQ